MYETPFIGFEPAPGRLSLQGRPILVDQDDFEGIHIAAQTLSADFFRVTGLEGNRVITHADQHDAGGAIIIGSLERSTTLQSLCAQRKIDISSIQDEWECFMTKLVVDPFPGCELALVIAGSDKRGAIYGTYTLSEQIGISPLHFWSDVPPQSHSEIYALHLTTRLGPPSVKYRGMFINDESPSLAGWVHERFGPVFNVDFYKHVFELLLRLKGNLLWPAMWFGYPDPGQSFFMDDVSNQETADRYGIVISTSHHEPMQRAANEWFSDPYHEGDGTWSWITNREKITNFFREGAERAKPFESYLTVGMRGEGDRKVALAGRDPQQVLGEVLQTQRTIIKDTYGREDGCPQVMALYKEVQQQYSAGLHVPDDVTLLFSDDNFGTARRLPYGPELKRSGGAGLYYHFEYVGHPRSYTWLNSTPIPKVHHQLDLAFRNGARQIWIFNVGDIKPMEVPLSFAMAFAWDTSRFPLSSESNPAARFLDTFATSTFGHHLASVPNATATISQLLRDYDRLVALRKHEHTEPESFSALNYSEWDSVESQWADALRRAQSLYDSATSSSSVSVAAVVPALFQLVLHPIKASSIYMSLRCAQAKNKLFALQRRNSANIFAARALRLFHADFDLSHVGYHARLAGGKWDHMMRQPHLGYYDPFSPKNHNHNNNHNNNGADDDSSSSSSSSSSGMMMRPPATIPMLGHEYSPSRDMISGLCYVQTRQDSNPIAGHMGVAVEGESYEGVRPGLCCEEADRTHPSRRDLVRGVTMATLEPHYGGGGSSDQRRRQGANRGGGESSEGRRGEEEGARWFELFSRGSRDVRWRIGYQDDDDGDRSNRIGDSVPRWITIWPSSGVLTGGGAGVGSRSLAGGSSSDDEDANLSDCRVFVSVDWDKVEPPDFHGEILVPVTSDLGDLELVHVPIAADRRIPSWEGEFLGFVESDGCVSINAIMAAETAVLAASSCYMALPGLGRAGNGVVGLRYDDDPDSLFTSTGQPSVEKEPLSFPFYRFTACDTVQLIMYFVFTLDTNPERPARYEIALDDAPFTSHRLNRSPDAPGDLPPDWFHAVMDTTWTRRHVVHLGSDRGSKAGRHVLKIRLQEPNCLLEKVVLDFGGVRASALGPPQSRFVHIEAA